MAAYNQHIADNDKVEFIHVSMDDDKKDALNWAVKAKLPWLHVLNSKARSSGMMKFAKGDGVPQYYLIDKEGKTLASGERAAFAKIAELTK